MVEVIDQNRETRRLSKVAASDRPVLQEAIFFGPLKGSRPIVEIKYAVSAMYRHSRINACRISALAHFRSRIRTWRRETKMRLSPCYDCLRCSSRFVPLPLLVPRPSSSPRKWRGFLASAAPRERRALFTGVSNGQFFPRYSAIETGSGSRENIRSPTADGVCVNGES